MISRTGTQNHRPHLYHFNQAASKDVPSTQRLSLVCLRKAGDPCMPHPWSIPNTSWANPCQTSRPRVYDPHSHPQARHLLSPCFCAHVLSTASLEICFWRCHEHSGWTRIRSLSCAICTTGSQPDIRYRSQSHERSQSTPRS